MVCCVVGVFGLCVCGCVCVVGVCLRVVRVVSVCVTSVVLAESCYLCESAYRVCIHVCRCQCLCPCVCVCAREHIENVSPSVTSKCGQNQLSYLGFEDPHEDVGLHAMLGFPSHSTWCQRSFTQIQIVSWLCSWFFSVSNSRTANPFSKMCCLASQIIVRMHIV